MIHLPLSTDANRPAQIYREIVQVMETDKLPTKRLMFAFELVGCGCKKWYSYEELWALKENRAPLMDKICRYDYAKSYWQISVTQSDYWQDRAEYTLALYEKIEAALKPPAPIRIEMTEAMLGSFHTGKPSVDPKLCSGVVIEVVKPCTAIVLRENIWEWRFNPIGKIAHIDYLFTPSMRAA